MIDPRPLVDAIKTRIATVVTCGDLSAPATYSHGVYAVLELPPGSRRTGAWGCPERSLALRFRVRVVAESSTTAVARQAAQDIAERIAVALLDRTVTISGTGWSVSGRTHIASGGADDEGPLVNVVDDYEFFVSS